MHLYSCTAVLLTCTAIPCTSVVALDLYNYKHVCNLSVLHSYPHIFIGLFVLSVIPYTFIGLFVLSTIPYTFIGLCFICYDIHICSIHLCICTAFCNVR